MRVMANRKIINKITRIIIGLLGVTLILITTGCEVQKVGSTPSKDYIIDPFPGPPVPPEIVVLPPNCEDGLDNDEDGLIDTLDTDCAEGSEGELPPPPVTILANCDDGLDNDNDGLIDSLDVESCGENGSGETTTAPGIDAPELPDLPPAQLAYCNDGIDNDNDGLIDSLDVDNCGTDGTGELPAADSTGRSPGQEPADCRSPAGCRWQPLASDCKKFWSA